MLIAGLPLAGLVDAVIALTAVEGFGLLAWHRLTGRGVAPRDFAVNLVAGLCLMLALRCAVRDTGALAIAAALLAAGAAHLTDLLLRWSAGSPVGRVRPDQLPGPHSPTHPHRISRRASP